MHKFCACLFGTLPLPNSIYQTKSTEPNFYFGDSTKFTKPNLQNRMGKIKPSKVWNVKNHIKQNIWNKIFSIKPEKLNQTNQFYQTPSRETKSTWSKHSPIQAWAELGPAVVINIK